MCNMYPNNNLIAVLFLSFTCVAFAQNKSQSENVIKIVPGFIFTIPKTLVSGKEEVVCITIHNIPIPVTSLINFEVENKHYPTRKTIYSESSCFPLLTPIIQISEPKFVHVQVQLNGVQYSARNEDPIIIYPKSPNKSYIDTDRNFYKPGDKVNIRILVVGTNFLPISENIPKVVLKNPLDVVVEVWQNVSLRTGLVQFDYQLPQESLTGKWKLQVNDAAKLFEVYKHVLPKFEIQLQYPKSLYLTAESVPITVCAKYSFGRPVNGVGFIKASGTTTEAIIRTSKLVNGCTEFTLTSDELGLDHINTNPSSTQFFYPLKKYLHIIATVTEQGTNKIHITTGNVLIHNIPYLIKFVGKQTFQPGLPYKGKLQFSNVYSNLTEEVIEICYNVAVRKSWNQTRDTCGHFELNNKNSIDFGILPLKTNVIHMFLNARSMNHSHIGDSFQIIRLYSASNSYINVEQIGGNTECSEKQEFSVTYTTDNFLNGQNVTFYYLVKTHEELYKSGTVVHTVKNTHPDYSHSIQNAIGGKTKHTKLKTGVDSFTIHFKIDKKLVSKYQIIVYYVTEKGETVTSTKTANIHPCSLPVEANWSKSRALPGEKASLNITTKGESLCSIASVDKSTTFLNNNHDLLKFSEFLKGLWEERQSAESLRVPCIIRNRRPKALTASEWDLRRRKRHTNNFAEEFDSYDVFNKFGTVVITNLFLITKPCYTGSREYYYDGNAQYMNEKYDDENDQQSDQIRHLFPDTWLWELIPVRDSLEVERPLPHTITNWVTNIMCVSESQGVGFSDEIEITSFQPFFVEILTPYSIKRSENFRLYVNVFNYLAYNIPVKIMLSLGTGLEMGDSNDKSTIISFCVPENNTKTHSFKIRGTSVGLTNISVVAEVDNQYPDTCGPETVVSRRDVVFKSLLVESEGYPITKTQSALLCVTDATPSNNVSWELSIPTNIVSGTDRAHITINGDLLAKTIENLDDLLGIPMGCGEQIMATMAPNLYVLKYLNAKNSLQLSRKKAIVRNLKKGYQNILNYVHKDGSFSAFGYHDRSGSMFLTAFVVRVLQEAKNYIYVNDRVIEKAVAWIYYNQLENGCFNTMNHVFQDMGGASTENSTPALTSYVIISLTEANIEIPETVKTNAKYCIRSQVNPDLYTVAISSYAFFKLDWADEGVKAVDRLNSLAHTFGNMMWWSNQVVNSSATDVEITGYVLLSLLHHNSTENLAHAHSVARWLVSKAGPKGGFKSTQDTVVSLNALTKYSTVINSRKLNVKVNIQAMNQVVKEIITEKDKIMSKEVPLKQTTNKIHVQVKGEGCVLIQTVLSYFLKEIPHSEAFQLSMSVRSVSTIDKCSIAALNPCIAYTGPDEASNMAILEVNLPSGYQADRVSLYRLIEQPAAVKKFEENNNQIILYITKLSKEQICVNFNINENTLVEEKKNSVVKLYDYYKPEYENLQFYAMNTCENIENLPRIANKVDVAEIKENVVKRSLNPKFVDMDVELDTPDGCEGTQVFMVNPNSTKPKRKEH